MGYLWPFYLPNSLKNQNLKKWKKTPGDISILQWCTKNHDHMLYCSWDIAHNRCNCYFSFWAIFFPFTSLTVWKMKIKKKKLKKKTPGNIIILQWCIKNHDHMLCCSWDMVGDRCSCYFSFWAIFCPFTLLTTQNSNFLKNEKNTCRYHHFT